MKQYNVKNIALALVLVGASSGVLASSAATLPAAGDTRPSWAREHAKTLFAGVSATAILGFAVYATIQVKRIDKQLNTVKSTPRTSRALALRAKRENWVFLRNIAWGALVVAGGLTAVGTVHHLTKDQAWAQKKDANWLAKIGQMVLGHKPTEKSLITPTTPAHSRADFSASDGAASYGASDGAASDGSAVIVGVGVTWSVGSAHEDTPHPDAADKATTDRANAGQEG